MSSTLQNLLVVAGVIVIGGVGFYLYTQQNSAMLNNTTVDTQAALQTSDFLTKLNQLKTVTLNDAIFHDTRFAQLVDYTTPLAPVPVGNANPFNIVGN